MEEKKTCGAWEVIVKESSVKVDAVTATGESKEDSDVQTTCCGKEE